MSGHGEPEMGDGIPQNYEISLRWYAKAANQGVVEAQYSLGVMYEEGRGVMQDYAVAVHWYRKAANQGLADAPVRLGLMYSLGEGVTQKHVSAYMWYSLAEESGHHYADIPRDILAKRMTLAQIAEAERLAREWSTRHGNISR